MFDRLAQIGEGAFGAFLMLGDPSVEASAELLDAIVDGGADMVEVGIPFSDPVADGPVIQEAAVRALDAGIRVDDCFAILRDFRARHAHIPVGILTYANLLAARGRQRFCADAAAAGVDSILVADVPSLEAQPFADATAAAGLDLIMIAAPNTPGQTLTKIARLGSGYTYCVARAGVTGVRDDLDLNHDRLLSQLASLDAPPAVLGFGISTPAQVCKALESGAAGVICGSAIVKLAKEQGVEAVRAFVAEMKAATRRLEQPACA
jgi:tryptophan synthase alpha chain